MSGQIETIAGRSQARFPAAVVLLGGGDAGVAHRILNGNQIFPVIQHGRGKGPAKIMWRTFCDPGLALAHLQDMVHRLVGQPVICQGVKPADAGEQGTRMFAPDLVNQNSRRCQVPAGI